MLKKLIREIQAAVQTLLPPSLRLSRATWSRGTKKPVMIRARRKRACLKNWSQHFMLDQWLDQHLMLDYHFCSSIFIIQTVNNWRSIPILRQDGTTRLRRSLCGHSSLVTKRYQVGHFSFGEHNSPLGRVFAALWPPWRLKGSSGTKTEKFFVPWHYESDGYGSIPINTIFRGMNIHLPAILMFTRGTRFWHTAIWGLRLSACCKLQPGWIIGLPMFCPVP